VGEDAPGTHWIGIRALDGSSLVHRRKVRIRAKDFPTQHLSLPEDSVTLSPPQLERYKTDKRAIRAALSSRTGKRLWNRPLLWPAHGKITSAYGLGRILNGKKRSPHTGVDLALASGTPVRSTDAGRVALTGKFLFEGKAVFIDHGRGLVSMYFHLASVAVQEGQIVERGEVIGHSGQSGRGTGAHLHFGLSALDRLINPLPLLRKQSAACSDNFIQ
jgi:murein DD-endopeptidase MepM/ murein hydrolase activator NlpD